MPENFLHNFHKFTICLLIRSPGFGLSLVAESTKSVLLSAESSSRPADEGNVISPEDLGRQTAVSLLEEIYRVGSR